jgi:hypothetical protein
VSSVYDVFVNAAAQALVAPYPYCDHYERGDPVYACLCCAGAIRCFTCHLDHLPAACPCCGAALETDLPLTHQVEHELSGPPVDGWALSPSPLTVHGEICAACAVDNDWPAVMSELI